MALGKNFINSINDAVQESLVGHILTYPHLELHASKRVVLAPGWSNRQDKVAVICGGGSGHEPFASGFVGAGMLTASISGSIYAAPPSSHILHAVKCVTKNNTGCFIVIPNYTGDCLNFGLGIEKAKLLNIKVGQVIVGDDCSIPENEQGRAGKRGLCGILFVIKIVGALAEKGKGIDEITNYAQLIVNNIATCGVALSACSIPGQGLMFELPDDEIEFGLGIHGEAGYRRIKLQSVNKIVSLMLNQIIKTLNLSSGDSVCAIINNFGALSQLEQGIVTQEVIKQLENMEIKVHRAYSGLLMTSLNGSGAHISVLKLSDNEKDTLLSCLDEKTDAPRWPGCTYSQPSSYPKSSFEDQKKESTLTVGPKLTVWEENLFKSCLQSASKAIIDQESKINALDRGCGDGDCGTTLRQLADGITSSLHILPWSYPSSLLNELALIAEERMGGSSGALYSLMFTTAAIELSTIQSGESAPNTWARVWRAGVNGIIKYSKAKLGDKTMLDSLDPACKELEKRVSESYKEIAKKVASAAENGCEATKNMIPKAGRASYVKQAKYLKEVDAGAFAVATWINAIAETIISFK